MSEKDTFDIKRNRQRITDIDRARGYMWHQGKRYKVTNDHAEWLEFAVLPQEKINDDN